MRVFSGAKLALILSVSAFAMNCSGKTYSTFFQPFDLVFGNRATTSLALLTATPLTNTRVMLTFSKPVTLSSGQLVGNYRITAPNGNLLQILAASRDPNNSNIIFIDTLPQTSGTVYTATASNIIGVDGSSLGNSNSATFTAPTNADQTGPQFSSVSVTTNTTLEVFFNEALDATTSATATNYRFYTGANAAAAVAACQADGTFSAGTAATGSVRDSVNFARVTLTRSAMTTGTIYAIGARNVRDIWGNAVANTTCSIGFLYTASTPRVVSAVSGSPTSVLVTFDQAMANAIQPTPAVGSTPLTTRANYSFANCGTLSASAATFSVVSSTQILLSGLVTGTTGTCTLTVNTAITSSASVALTAATQSAIFSYSAATDTTAPAVASVQATNSNTVRVTFTEPINDSTVGTGDFSFSPSLTVTGVTCYTGAGNYTYCDVTTSTDQTTQNYSATISGIQDVAGNSLTTSTTTFTGDGKPYIVAIYPVDSSTVMVEWSEPIGPRSSIDDTTAGDGFDYTLSPLVATDISEVRLSPTGGAAGDYSPYVRISLATAMASGTTYTLAYSDVAPTGGQDATGNGLLTTVPNGGTFTGPTSTQAPRVTSASSNAATTVIVNFNEPLNNATIDNGDFVLSGPVGCPTVVTGTPIQVSAGVVQLVVTTVSQAGPTTCTVTVNTVSDLAGNAIGGTNNSANFSYSGTDATDETSPTVVSVSALSNTQVRIYFSEPVDDSNGVNGGENFADNYLFSPALSGSITGADCPSPYTYCTLTLSAPGTSAVQYALTVRNIEDRASPTPRIMSSQTVNFSGIGSSVTAPTLYQAVLINSMTVELSFTESMGLTSVECTSTGTCATKYTVTGGNSVSAAVRQADTTKVRLTITPGAYGSSNSYTVTATGLTDTAGNTIGTPNSATFSGSATAPATTNLGDSSDLGVSNSDNATNPCVFSTVSPCAAVAPGLVFTGTTTANTTVYLFDDGVIVGVAVSDSSGNYSITLTSAGTTVTNGNNVFNVATVGPTGLVSDLSPGLTVNYDASAPGNPAAAADLVAGSDTGISSTDNITSDTTPTLSGSGLTAGDYVYIYDGATLIGAALVDGSGNWTWTLTSGDTTMAGAPADQITYAAAGTGLSAGAHTITYKVGDTAGNESAAASPALNLTVDATAPVLNTSPLTGNTTLTLTFSENVYKPAGGSLATTDFAIAFAANGGTATGASITGITHTAPSGTVVLTLSYTGTISGTETITVTSVAGAVVDAAGNAASVTTGAKTLSAIGVASITGTPTYTSTGTTTGYITVTWSEGVYTSNGPSGSVVAADFTRAFTQNSGNSTDATVTCVTDTASASCPGTAPAAGATTMRIHLTNTGATSGVETIQVSAATGEIHSGTNGVTPNTVNTGTLTFPDRLAPSAPAGLDLALADDSGSSNSDNITSQTANLTISGTAEANSTVRIYLTSSAGTLLQTVTADGSGNWSGDITLSAGVNSIVATARDAALNVSSDSTALSITIDTSAPAATGTPDLQAASDLGSSTTDNITNDTTPTFDISCVTGTTVQLYSDAVATGTSGTCASGTVTLTSGSLGAGSRTITAVQTDPAGNASVASAGLSVTIDTTADAATGTPDLQAASDTGSSNSDNITNDTTPTFDISCVTGSTVQLYSDAVATGTSAVCAGSTVTLTTGALSAGSRSITAVQTDAAGNASVASGALAITLDTTADAATGTPDLQAASDTGSSNSDNITNDTTPTFDISCVTGSTVQLYSDAVATGSSAVCAGGTVTLTTAALTAGARSITAVQTDPAGNASVASSALSVTIDTGNPAAPAALNLADADDTGTSNSDNITRNTTALTIDGTSEANATVRIYLTSSAGTLLQTVTANGSGVWSGDITLSEGVNSVVATATDAGGNTSTDSTGLSITVDATADAAPGTPDMTAGTDSGSSNSDNLTSNQTPSFTVSCVNGSSVQLYDNTTSTGTAVTCAGGSATVTAGTLSAGTHSTMNAKQTDAAGNESAASGNLSITIDITGPTVSSVTSSTGDGTYGLSQVIAVQVVFNESVTVSGNPQLTLETGAIDAVVNYSSGSPGATLTFNYTVAAGHSSGDLDYVANSSLQFNGGTIVDAAGNSATLTLPDPGQPNSLGANKAIVIATPNGPQIQTAEYYDTDGNGKIDHVKLTFDKNIDDATMDGYNSSGSPTNQLHNVTTVWSVAGYSNVRLDTRDTINNVNPADNGTNDTAIWLAFDEVGGATYDTGAKPNLLATDSSLKSTVGAGGCFVQTDSANCSTQTSADILTASVVEADKAPAIIIGATGVTTSQYLTITFSEPVDASNDGSCSGTLSHLDIQYTDTSAAGVDALDSNAGNWTNTNACDDNAVAARLMDGGVGANLDAGSINSDTVNPASGRIYDIGGNVSLTTPTRVVTGAVAPYVVSVSATGARKIRITFSEAVVNAQATVLGNYTLIENPTETGCAGSGSDTVSLTGTVTAISASIYELDTNADQCSTTTYRLTASSSITDVNESLGIATPAFGTFLGNERLKVSSATCLSTTSFKVVFNKAVRSGSGAGGAETTTRYKVTGPISLGAFSSATRGTSPNDNEVTIVHVVEQTGSAFTAIGANAVNGDGFDDVAAGTIQNSDLSESLQQSPRDRAGFSGCGTAIDNFNQGPITSNPFGDGTDAGNVVSYDGKIYVGTNNNGNSVARFNPDGSNPTLAQFEFTKDVTGGTHANTATTRDGGIAVPPYVTLGYSGCTSLNANQNGGCGPDNEDGRGTFAVGTLGASNYLFVGGSRSTANFDYIYYTADTDSTLNWSYIDLGTITGTATQGLQSMAVMNDRVYAGMAKNNSGGPNNLPDFGKVNFSSSSPGGDCVPGSTCDATDGTNGNRFRIDFMPYFGGASAGGTTTGMNYAFIVGVDSMIVFNNRLYAANGGYHQVDRNGTIIRSNNTNPIACSAVNTCADWTEIGPRSNAAWFNSPTNNRFSLQLTKIANIFPYDKAFAQFAIYNNRLFVTRTVCNIANGALVAAQTAAPAADPGCTDGTDTNRRAQLWKCDPASTGNATECDAADWSIVADDSTGVTNMGVAGNRSMTMVVANGSYLYIGYDNGGGIQIWRTNTANPGAASASWSQIGGNGLGDTTNMLNIYSATSVQQGADYYIYVSAGKSGQPLAVYRQKN
ncbi:beta strand repeat-containing protein [Turneriella parva]|uniref:Bacterial Ig-like domain-containing protein n=1 Tax=Turneriella parva (strain ATCC BAA-1111 / DSM 21527 / NCTC 11395 / H) TaxID=869212 RepID=I4BBQ9_TURPD|nr:Ig-like domain-containing protein [Turneriella parva]AFM14716.1 hypothetical protein Turpa_4082 [Turneriella parva DSM 21527]